MPPMHVQTAVLGGGITGLCAGTLLAGVHGPDAVLVLEASNRAGGYAQTETVEGYQCDWGPNGFLDKEPLMLEWIASLGISDELVRADEAAARRFLLIGGRLVELLPPPTFLVSPLLSVSGRMRLLCEPLIKAKRDDAPESIWHFAARRIGKEAADTLVASMVTGVFGGDAKRLSLEHCFPRMAEMERTYGGLFKAMKASRKKGGGGPMGPGGTLTTFRGGIGRLAERAAEVLGDRLRTGFEAAAIARQDGGYRVLSTRGEEIEAENMIVTIPVNRAAKLLAGFDDAVADALRTVEQAPITVVCTAYDAGAVRHDMHGFGFLVPPGQNKRVLGCIWTSSVFPGSAPEGRILLRSMFGGTRDPKAVNLSNEELLDCLKGEVHPVMGIDTAPGFMRVFRHREGIPQYGLNHEDVLNAVERCEEANPGLAFAGNGYRGVSLNDCVVSAQRACHMIQNRG